MFCYISKYFYNSIPFKFGFGIKVYLRFGVFSEGRSCVESEKVIYIFCGCVRCYISNIYFCFFMIPFFLEFFMRYWCIFGYCRGAFRGFFALFNVIYSEWLICFLTTIVCVLCIGNCVGCGCWIHLFFFAVFGTAFLITAVFWNNC